MNWTQSITTHAVNTRNWQTKRSIWYRTSKFQQNQAQTWPNPDANPKLEQQPWNEQMEPPRHERALEEDWITMRWLNP